MVNINGTNYITLKRYGELHNISLSRVSQLKGTLPIEHIDELNVDLINWDLVTLKEEIRRAAEQEFVNRESLASYSTAQLGDYFVALIARLTKQATQAEQHRQQAEERLTETRQAEQQAQTQVDELQQALTASNEQLTQLRDEIETLQIDAGRLQRIIDEGTAKVQAENEQLKSDKRGLQIALKTLEDMFDRHGIGSDTKPVEKFKAIKKGKQRNQKSESETAPQPAN